MATTLARTFGRYIALPAVSAGIIGAAALGMAGMANAAPATGSQGTDNSHSRMFTPSVKANPAPTVPPGWHHNHGVWRAERLEPGYHR
jgi:hypothetical protein